LADVVDYHVLVEATITHSDQPKPLYFQEAKSRFAEFSDKIIHIVLEDLPRSNNCWKREKFQRRGISEGLRNAQKDDIILVSDADEIPSSDAVKRVKSFLPKMGEEIKQRGFTNKPPICHFKQRLHYYYLNNGTINSSWTGTRATLFRRKNTNPQKIYRSVAKDDIYTKVINNAGWHYSFLGNLQHIKQKINAYAHQEFRGSWCFTDIAGALETGLDLFGKRGHIFTLRPQEELPKYVRDNLDKFEHLLFKAKK